MKILTFYNFSSFNLKLSNYSLTQLIAHSNTYKIDQTSGLKSDEIINVVSTKVFFSLFISYLPFLFVFKDWPNEFERIEDRDDSDYDIKDED